MKKHAYLIIIHNNYYTLEKLVKMLDDIRNDIYIHVDKKVKDFPFKYFTSIIERSSLKYVKRVDVRWGKYSVIQATMNLFKESVNGEYVYYHLLSGQDLPIKSQDYIHKFFEENEGKEFVTCTTEQALREARIIERFNFYHFFGGRRLHDKIVEIQRDRISRYKGGYEYNYGSNWVSITDELVKLILTKEKWIKKTFRFTECCDEVFVQSIVMNSEYKNQLYRVPKSERTISFNMRYINWSSGSPNPDIFVEDDWDHLSESECLFARKFDENRDKKIIDLIFKKYS